jgi:hypothetical protein
MYKTHPNFISPSNPDVKIWRYLDFTKLISLLDRKALFFPRAYDLNDPFEGVMTRINKKAMEEMIKQYPLLRETFPDFRKHVMINSWHMNDFESAALWKIYLSSVEGVAIQTTFTKLVNSFELHKEDNIYIGIVKYTDYENEVIDMGNIFNPFLHKRKSFEHEKEIRAIILKLPPIVKAKMDFDADYGKGLYVNVDLDNLIEKVYISPYSEEWFYDLVCSITKKYELKAEVIKSSLNQKPDYLT